MLSAEGYSLQLNENNPFRTIGDFANSDTDGSLIYLPKEFDYKNHGGLTKLEILNRQRESNLAGYELLFLEDLPNLPRNRKVKIIKDRKQIEAGFFFSKYLKQLRGDAQYKDEQGLTPEAWISYFLTHLDKANQVIDDWMGHGSSCWLTGAYHTVAGSVPIADWDNEKQQAFLSINGPRPRMDSSGLRTAVRIGNHFNF